MNYGTFDTQAFLAVVDQERQRRGVHWKDVALATGIPRDNLRLLRIGRRHACTVHSLAALVVWSGIDPRPFMRLETV